uniref:Protein kinase domain-containing protein n=1 Tax=Strongyloides venezuelensis TaxID=75913 RepID=A0A0K0G1Y4_STRVS
MSLSLQVTCENETIPDIYVKLPSEVEDKSTETKYKIQHAIRLGTFSYAYRGINAETKKEIVLKYISSNSFVIIDAIMTLLKDNPDVSKYILPFVGASICKSTLKPFLVMEGGWNNLSELINWNGPKVFNPNCFIMPASRAVLFLHKHNIVHGNIKTSSFWYRQQKKCKENDECRMLCIENLVLGDYEEGFIRKVMMKSKQIPLTIDVNVEINHVSEQRKSRKLDNLKYCALMNHNGTRFERENDYESLCYVLFELYEHGLPWEDIVNNDLSIRLGKFGIRSPESTFFYNTPEHLAELLPTVETFKDYEDLENPISIDDMFEITYENYELLYLSKKVGDFNLSNSDYIKKAGAFRIKNKIPTIFNIGNATPEEVKEKKEKDTQRESGTTKEAQSTLRKENRKSIDKKKSQTKSIDKRKSQNKSMERRKTQAKSIDKKRLPEESEKIKRPQEKSVERSTQVFKKKTSSRRDKTKISRKKSFNVKRSIEMKLSKLKDTETLKEDNKKKGTSTGLFKKLLNLKSK